MNNDNIWLPKNSLSLACAVKGFPWNYVSPNIVVVLFGLAELLSFSDAMLHFYSTFSVQVFLPFEGFKPTFRGGVVPGAPKLQPERLRQIGFMISKLTVEGGKTPNFQPGPFRLGIKTLRVFK